MSVSSDRVAILDRGASTGGSIWLAMVRSAAAADSELVTSLISFTPPQTQAAASTHRFLPAARCAATMASSARAASSTSSRMSASSLKFDISSFRFDLNAIDIYQPRCNRPELRFFWTVWVDNAISTAENGHQLHCLRTDTRRIKMVARIPSQNVTHETRWQRREAPAQTAAECSNPTLEPPEHRWLRLPAR